LPSFRSDLESVPTYDPGPPSAEIAAGLGLERIIEMADNECPTTPFPEVEEAIAAAASSINRYPLSDASYLAAALADHYHVDKDRLWVGPGSTGILTTIALATSGSGTSVVFGDPSFVVYRMATLLAGAEPIPVPLDTEWRLDPDAMLAAIRPDTTLMYFCNPNNPTGTHRSSDDVARLVAAVPDSITLVIDEAYAEYVTAADHATAIPLVLARDNVVVSRTFSKVYGLAGARVGYALGDPETIRSLRRLQFPFATGTLAQVAATEALRHQGRVQERVAANSAGRDFLAGELRRLDQFVIDSQTNFVLWRPQSDPADLASRLLSLGVMVRAMGPWIRVTVGTEAENRTLIDSVTGML
jgi:histidinol-phosphate aminotransferase